jgi:predicted RNA-binding protein Jag
MPKSIEAQGVTVDEAIQTALNLLGLGRDSVEIEIIHHPRSGFLGIGARRAKVRATMREQVMKDGEEFDMAPDAGSRGRRRRRPSRGRTPRGGSEQRPREQRPGGAEGAGRRAGPETRAAAPAIPAQKSGAGEGEAAGPTERRSGEQRGRGRGRRRQGSGRCGTSDAR